MLCCMMRWAFPASLLLWSWVVGSECSRCEYEEYLGLNEINSDTTGIPALLKQDKGQPPNVPRRLFKLKSLWNDGTAHVSFYGPNNVALVLATGKKQVVLQSGTERSFLHAVPNGRASIVRIRFRLMSAMWSYYFGYNAALRVKGAKVVSWVVMPGMAGLVAGTLLPSGEKGKIYHFTEPLNKMHSQANEVDAKDGSSGGSSFKKGGKIAKKRVQIGVALFQPCDSSFSPSIPNISRMTLPPPYVSLQRYLPHIRPEMVDFPTFPQQELQSHHLNDGQGPQTKN